MSYDTLLFTRLEGAIYEVAHWERLPVTDPELISLSARGFRGRVRDWTFVVNDFSIESQGFPPGSRGYTGTAVDKYAVVTLTPELSQLAVELALMRS